MKYYLAFHQPAEQVINIKIATIGQSTPCIFHLPKWRPGRYELQRFDKNVSDVQAKTPSGRLLPTQRLTTHSWQVDAKAGEVFYLTYTYYANGLDAGSSYFDKERIYVNGINLMMYREELLDEACELYLKFPGEGYEMACGLPHLSNHWYAADYHQLVDAPLLAGRDLKHHQFMVQGVSTHLWFQGECDPDMDQLEKEIRAYSEAQLTLFGECPVDTYHYLVVIVPRLYRHGVEHYNSTVISIGPGVQFNQDDLRRAFVEVCSHELFHTWNVKAIRPKDMLPYDYGGENYSSLHYITEGVTTYYGDLMIWKGGKWKLQDLLRNLNFSLKRYYSRGGKDFISLSQASFESWVNAYSRAGTPNRQISFYTKGSLVTFLMDIEIRRLTQNDQSFDDVMYTLYHEFGKKGLGYAEKDILDIIRRVSGQDFSDFFQRFIHGTDDLEAALQAAGAYIGLEIQRLPFESWAFSFWGVEVNEKEKRGALIENVYPDSPAAQAGLSKGDEIISLNSLRVEGNLEHLIKYIGGQEAVQIHYFHLGKLKKTSIQPNNYFHYLPQFAQVHDPTQRQRQNLHAFQQVKKRASFYNQMIK